LLLPSPPRLPCLSNTPGSGFPPRHARFSEPEDAGVVGAEVEVMEGEEAGVGFAELGAAADVAVAGGFAEMLDCGASASSRERLRAPTVTAGIATSTARDSFFALRFIDLLLTEMRVHRNRDSLEFRHDGEESG
jgi:hypothetical protein